MRDSILEILRKITEEEQAILDGENTVKRDLYTNEDEFIIDSRLLLQKGRLIEIRPHTRFVHFPRHRHNYIEMIYMCSGETTHIIDGHDRITLKEGDLLFLNQYATQEILPAGMDDIAVNFIILPQFFDRTLPIIERENVLRDFIVNSLSDRNALSRYLYFEAADIVPVQNLMENMIWTLLSDRSDTNTINQMTMGLVILNLSMFANKLGQQGSIGYEQNLVFSVLRYIETHYRNGSLADISAELKQPDYSISRLLKKYTNCSFKELLQRRKLQQAEYLLSNTSLPADTILDVIGYENSSYFYKKFREKYGMSPKEYRRNG